MSLSRYPRYFACFSFSNFTCFSTIFRCGWSLTACLESNLAFVRSDQSIARCLGFAYLCGVLKSLEGWIWVRFTACGCDDSYANDCPCHNGSKIWSTNFAWGHCMCNVFCLDFSSWSLHGGQ